MMAPTAIVTGAARGIGRSIALRLARDGYSVGINDIPHASSEIDALVSEMNCISRKTPARNQTGPLSQRPTALALPADVSSTKDVASMISKTTAELGPLTLMIANAGIAPATPMLQSTKKDLDKIFSINVGGVFNCYSEAARQMIAQGDPKTAAGVTKYKIVGAASIAGFRAVPGCGVYSASKFAVRGLTQAMAAEMARHHITVNAYAPGVIGTPMWDEIDEAIGSTEGRAKGETMEFYSKGIALGRAGTPDDIAGLVGGFLASKDSDYVTGQTILVDGGMVFT